MFILLLEWGMETLEKMAQTGEVCLVWAEGGD